MIVLQPYRQNEQDENHMQEALRQARFAAERDEVPIGAVIVGTKALTTEPICIAQHNLTRTHQDPTAHAEMLALREACRTLGTERLGQHFTLYVTLQPCVMCLGAILHARIGRVVVGTEQSRYSGPIESVIQALNENSAYAPCVIQTGCLGPESQHVLESFFQKKRPERIEHIKSMQSMLQLPNVNKALSMWLHQQGVFTPEQLWHQHQANGHLLAEWAQTMRQHNQLQESAILLSLIDYFAGYPVKSWTHY